MCRNYCDIQQKHSEITTLYTFHSILIVLLQLVQHCCYNHCFCYYVSSNFYYNNYWCCNNHRLYMKIKCNFLVCKEKPMRKYLKHAFFPMASRGRLFGCKNKSLYRIYAKMTLLLNWFITPLNDFLMSLLSQSVVWSLTHYSTMFILLLMGPLRVKLMMKQYMQPYEHVVSVSQSDHKTSWQHHFKRLRDNFAIQWRPHSVSFF